MPTMGNAFCVLGSCGSGGMGTAGPFFRIFESDVFFMVGLLWRCSSESLPAFNASRRLLDLPARVEHSF
jgi:hypothetical protein